MPRDGSMPEILKSCAKISLCFTIFAFMIVLSGYDTGPVMIILCFLYTMATLAFFRLSRSENPDNVAFPLKAMKNRFSNPEKPDGKKARENDLGQESVLRSEDSEDGNRTVKAFETIAERIHQDIKHGKFGDYHEIQYSYGCVKIDGLYLVAMGEPGPGMRFHIQHTMHVDTARQVIATFRERPDVVSVSIEGNRFGDWRELDDLTDERIRDALSNVKRAYHNMRVKVIFAPHAGNLVFADYRRKIVDDLKKKERQVLDSLQREEMAFAEFQRKSETDNDRNIYEEFLKSRERA